MDTIMGYDAVLVESLLAVVFGVLILIAPKILNYLVGAYLIIIGVIGLWPHIQAATNSGAASTETAAPATTPSP